MGQLKKPHPSSQHSLLNTSPLIASQLPPHPLLAQYHTLTGSGKEGGRDEDTTVKSGGLALLVKRCFGKPLSKTQQLSDWEKRPLTQEQLTYAGEYTVFQNM